MRIGSPSLWALCATAIVLWADRAAGADAGTPGAPRVDLSYEVIDGWAVHGGDIVLGRAEDLAGEVVGALPVRGIEGARPHRDSTTTYDAVLWPHGRIPYVIDPGFSSHSWWDIHDAIEEWNTKTVVHLQYRTTELDYVRFRPTTERCRSSVGKVGGEQSIWWAQDRGQCGEKSSLLHEIGHTVGMWHEHQRTDRDEYLTVREEGLLETARKWIVENDHPAHGHYDFASVMHYQPLSHSRDGLPVLESIPPGIQIRPPGGGLSPGDIEKVAILYHSHVWPTTISSNPPGLDILVNNERVTTPVKYFWQHGRIRSIRAPSPQEKDGSRYVFARWNDNRAREHNINPGDEGTWFEANFIVQHSITGSAYPESGGSVTFDPPSPDGYYTLRTELNADPVPDTGAGFRFWRWQLWRSHGLSSDPARILVANPVQFAAHFTTEPLFRIESTVGPFLLHVNDEALVGPVALNPGEYGDSVHVSVPPVQTLRASNHTPGRYRFQGWMDGGPLSREIDVSDGGKLVALFQAEHNPGAANPGPTAGPGAVDAQASAGDGYDPGGSSGGVTAVGDNGWDFVQWMGDSSGAEAPVTGEMDRASGVGSALVPSAPAEPRPTPYAAPARRSFLVAGGEQRFRVDPPPGSRRIMVRFEPSDPSAEADLTGFAGNAGVPWESAQGRTPRLLGGGYRSVESGHGETIIISEESVPPLDQAQSYFFSLSSSESPYRIAGTVHVEIETAGLAPAGRVSPRALTFVAPSAADAPPQRVTLSNPASGIMRYRFDTGTPWLSAEPREGVLQAHESVEIAVRAHSAGIEPDTYHRDLRVQLTDGTGKPVGERTVRVTFAVVPPASNPQVQLR